MTNYTVRVELHDADDNDYELLYQEMGSAGFSKYIRIDGKTSYKLPTAEYSIISELDRHDILAKAEKAAKRAKPSPTPSVLVTGSDSPRAFSGLQKS